MKFSGGALYSSNMPNLLDIVPIPKLMTNCSNINFLLLNNNISIIKQ